MPLLADLANVESELAQRTTGMPNEAAQRGLILIITTGWRSLDEQWRFYNDMVVAKQKYGRRWQQQHAALAAYPGTSDQGKTPATAVDLACASPTKQNIKTQQAPASRQPEAPTHRPPGEADSSWRTEWHRSSEFYGGTRPVPLGVPLAAQAPPPGGPAAASQAMAARTGAGPRVRSETPISG